VAHAYHVEEAELAAVNQMGEHDNLQGIEALVVPVPLSESHLARALYTVRRGDTLVTIADRFGVSLSQLRRWNGIPSGIRVEPGRRLHVAEPVVSQKSSGSSRRGARRARQSASAAGDKAPKGDKASAGGKRGRSSAARGSGTAKGAKAGSKSGSGASHGGSRKSSTHTKSRAKR